MGLAQGGANLGNGATNVIIAIPNAVAHVYNNTAGWFLPNCPYIPFYDWSKNLITEEPDWVHTTGKVCGSVAFIAATWALLLEAAAPRITPGQLEIERMREFLQEGHAEMNDMIRARDALFAQGRKRIC